MWEDLCLIQLNLRTLPCPKERCQRIFIVCNKPLTIVFLLKRCDLLTKLSLEELIICLQRVLYSLQTDKRISLT